MNKEPTVSTVDSGEHSCTMLSSIAVIHIGVNPPLNLSLADFQHKITVQASPSMDKRRSLNSTSSSPPSSPTLIPRLRAIQRESSPLWASTID